MAEEPRNKLNLGTIFTTIFTMLLGAGLTMFGTWVANTHQTSLQHKQFLFHSRYMALKSYSAISSKSGDILSKLIDFRAGLDDANLSKESVIQAIDESHNLFDEYVNLMKEVGIEKLVMKILIDIEPSSLPEISIKRIPKNFPLLDTQPQRDNVITVLREEAAKLQSKILEFNKQVSAYIDKASKLIRDEH